MVVKPNIKLEILLGLREKDPRRVGCVFKQEFCNTVSSVTELLKLLKPGIFALGDTIKACPH
jgi:hypothetical protein